MIEVSISSPANGIALTGSFARASGLAPAEDQPELRFVQLYPGREVVLHDGTLRGAGFARWLQIAREGAAVTHVEISFAETDGPRFHSPEAWLDRVDAPGSVDGQAEIVVATLHLTCASITQS